MIEQFRSSQTESAPKLTLQEQFITDLYQKTLDWLTTDKNGKIVAELKPQEIDHWDSYQPLGPENPTVLRAEIEMGALIQVGDLNFALVLSKRRRSKYDRGDATLGMQFGVEKQHPKDNFGKQPIEDAKTLTNLHLWRYGYGEFHIDERGRITIDCWADDSKFAGGQNVNKRSQEEIMTSKGLDACLEIVQRTTRNAFIR